jgi:hypothetical protein
MQPVDFKNAYYIKLGEGGKWEESSIRENKVRIGWVSWPIEEINQRNWANLKRKHRNEYKDDGSATRDINGLKNIVESTSDDIWITFHASYLWWCRVGESGILEDKISKYRKVAGQWNNRDVCDQFLILNQIPGSISKKQRFSGTICSVKKAEAEDLRRLLNNEPSNAHQEISRAKNELIEEVEKGLKGLHWKDFEILVDLIFRNAGWRRVSIIGGTMKSVDIELEEPITGDLYQVQVKSAATIDDFKKYAQNFSSGSFRKLYFVVHSPEAKLANYQDVTYKEVELILPRRLAQMVVDFGLTDWLLKKIR